MAVPAPTKTQLFTIIQDSVRIPENFLANQTIPADAGTLEASAGGKTDFAAQVSIAAGAFDVAFADALRSQSRELLRWGFTSLAHHEIGVPTPTLDVALDEVYKWMDENDERIQTRGLKHATTGTYSNPTRSGDTVVGNGVFRRVVVDERGYSLDAHHAEVLTFRCTSDAQSSTTVRRHQERWRASGQNAPRTTLGFGAATGSGGIVTDLRTIGPRDTLLKNGDWSRPRKTDAASPGPVALGASDTLNKWTVTSGSITSIQLDNTAAHIYRADEAAANPQSLRLTDNVTFEQDLNAEKVPISLVRPYDRQMAVMRKDSCDGTLTVTCAGVVVFAVDLTTLTNDQFSLQGATLDKTCWPVNWDTDTPKFEIKLESNTTGSVVLGTAMLTAMVPIAGTFWHLAGGSTRWRVDDQVTFDDDLPGPEGLIAKHLFLHTGRRLPSAPAAPSSGPTAALAGAGAGNVDDGAHTYAVTFVDVDGNESGVSATDDVTVADQGTDGKVDLTSIPTGTAAIVSRKVYRSAAGTTTPLLLLTTIADNVTTTYQDNTADSGLGAAAPAGVTLADPS